MAEEKTVVLFRKYPEGDILAIFPEIPSDRWGYECMVYQHLGQHGGGDVRGMMQATKPAKPSEYKDLKRELEQIGYDLEVRERISPAMHEKRRENARRPVLGCPSEGPREDDEVQSPLEAMRHTVRIIGEQRPEKAWILTDQDVWLQNPYYKGPPVPHPEMRDFD